MFAGGQSQEYGKNLSPDAQLRWSAIANRLTQMGAQPQTAAGFANNNTRDSIARRLNMVRENSYVTPQ